MHPMLNIAVNAARRAGAAALDLAYIAAGTPKVFSRLLQALT